MGEVLGFRKKDARLELEGTVVPEEYVTYKIYEKHLKPAVFLEEHKAIVEENECLRLALKMLCEKTNVDYERFLKGTLPDKWRDYIGKIIKIDE